MESPDPDLLLIPNSMYEFAQIFLSPWATVFFFVKYKMEEGTQEEREGWCYTR